MANADEFLQFIAEEVGRDGARHLTLDAPKDGPHEMLGYWVLGVKRGEDEGLLHGDSLTDALNKLSIDLNYTHKALHVSEEDSLVKRAAEMAKQVGSTLTISAPSGRYEWVVSVEGTRIKVEAFTLEGALLQVTDELERRGMRGE